MNKEDLIKVGKSVALAVVEFSLCYLIAVSALISWPDDDDVEFVVEWALIVAGIVITLRMLKRISPDKKFTRWW